jgi:hypothetical protein
MPFDLLDRARKLRAKAADPAVPKPERDALIEKAKELESRHRNLNPPPANQTIPPTPGTFGTPDWEEVARVFNDARMRRAAKIAQDLLDNQWKWNTEYYDKEGNPKQPGPDLDDIIDEDYKYAEEDENGG